MRKRFRRQLDEDFVEEPLINLTPLIDVVFVVLITFLIIAPVLDIDQVDLAKSGGTEKTELKAGPISISVHADNSLWMGGKKVTFAELESLLRKEKKKHPQAIPQIIHDQKAQFGTYQALKNSLEAIGFERMDVVLKPG
jgi:biopolymer transport protein ExbD